jgi:hypothetical protein
LAAVLGIPSGGLFVLATMPESWLSSSRLGRALRTVLISAVAATALGAILGLTLGWFAPGYYRSVFEGGSDPLFSPVQVGLGLGASQGAIAGLVVGVVLVWASYQSPRAVGQTVRSKSGAWALGGLILFALVSYGTRLLDEPRADGVRFGWHEKQLSFHNFGLRDKVVTHIAAGGNQAALTPPVYLKSHYTQLDIDPRNLKWIDYQGHPTDPPKPGEPVEIIAQTVFPIPGD